MNQEKRKSNDFGSRKRTLEFSASIFVIDCKRLWKLAPVFQKYVTLNLVYLGQRVGKWIIKLKN
ncbi:hypothetical protein CWO92_18185 [Heyndrickxia camelliae]|uniref:Uncharacterized protein n=1 Tax=Heyndrickxia camelliae TaxID=1707093 RepID=A0A2N3LGG5_9BACI|nr:hypothetical protein CWO92_18185 [Heyndrickxia camelliae]